jgi:hypothetical protein
LVERPALWVVGANASLANYVPRTEARRQHRLVRPDGDGVQGVDYDNNPATGVNGQETTWKDIAGNLVDCSTSGNPARRSTSVPFRIDAGGGTLAPTS